jgi:hypothetical protein
MTAKCGLLLAIAAAGICVALVIGILLYSGISPNWLKAGLSDRPTIWELPDLELAPSARTDNAPEVKPPPQIAAPIPPRTVATAPPQAAPIVPPEMTKNNSKEHYYNNGRPQHATGRHHLIRPSASIQDWGLGNGSPPSEQSEPPLERGDSPHPEPPQLEPFFPWPPPQPYVRGVIPRDVFTKEGIQTFGGVSVKISTELRKKGYSEFHYYSVPDGFAMVTRLERVDSSGHPVAASQRWQDFDNANFALTEFSLTKYMIALLEQREGFFRLFVFIISPHELIPAPNLLVTPEMAREWQQGGSATLPDNIANRLFSPEYKVYVLVYEFKKVEGQPPQLIRDSSVAEQFNSTHLSFAQ